MANRAMPERFHPREFLAAFAWYATVAIVATAPALFGPRSLGPEFLLDADPLYAQGAAPGGPPVFDPTRYYYDLPRDRAAADGFRHGRIDLWNPLVGMGMPLWSQGGAQFFPAKLPFYVSPSRRTYDLASALRLVIAGLGAFALARRRGLTPVPAAAAGTLYELSGATLSTLQLGVMAPPCMLPWVVLGAHEIAHRRTLAAAVGSALALAIAAGSGHPMLVTVVAAGFAAAVLGHALAAWRRPRAGLAIGGLALLAAALAATLAAPALLPILEGLETGRLYKRTGMYALQLRWFDLQTAASLPIALFAPATLDGLRAGLPPAFPYVLVAPVAGLFGLVFGAAGLLRCGLDAGLVAIAVAGLGMTLSPPGLGLVRRLPMLEFVYPMYAWALVILPITQAAGRGVAALGRRAERWAVLTALAGVLAAASSLALIHDVWPNTLMQLPVRQVFAASLAVWPGWLRLVLPLVLVPLAVLGLLVAGRRAGNWVGLAAIGLIALELLVCAAPVTWFPDSAVLRASPSAAVRFLQERLAGANYRLHGTPSVGTPSTSALFELADVRGASALPVERYVRYLEAVNPKASWYVWQNPGDVLRHPLLDLAAARYLVRPAGSADGGEPALDGDTSVRLAYADERVRIYENAAALPRARVARETHGVATAEEAARRLMALAAGHAHAADAGLVDAVVAEPSADGIPPPAASTAPLSAHDRAYLLPGDDPDRVDVVATLGHPGWVVLADTYHPGWTATIDGAPAPIHPIDVLFRGVFAPAGTHRVVFHYAPPWLPVGTALAGAGALACALLVVWERRWRRAGVRSGAP